MIKKPSTYVLVVTLCSLGALATAQQTPAPTASPDDISGTYTFLQDGEVLQLTVEDGKLSGYVSRFGDTDSDRGRFISQFFDKTSLQGDKISFNTQTVHGVWYEFTGVVAVDNGKKPGGEGYRVLRGKLTEHSVDANGKQKSRQRQSEFKSFPAEVNR